MISINLRRRVGFALLALGVAASAAAFSFVLNRNTGLPVKWPAGSTTVGTIPVRIMLGDTRILSDGLTYNTSARAAAQTWNSLIGSVQIQTTFTSGSPTNGNDLNEMGFSNTVFGRPFDPGTLAVTTGSTQSNERVEADIIFNNSAFEWDSYRGNLRQDATDLQRVAIHELGHLLGLDHPDENGQPNVNAIMRSRINNVDTVTADDTEGVRSLYGPPGVPANDAFANATTITLNATGTVTVKGFNTNATKETGEPRQADTSGGRSVWWRWTAPSAGTMTIDTGKEHPTNHVTDVADGKSSTFDTTLGVYTGTSLASLTKVADNDDINPGVVQISTLTFTAAAGTVYRFAVDGYNNGDQDTTDHNGADNGGITLSLNFTSTGGSVPIISTQPASLTVNSGNSASFSVVATSTPDPTYQWRFNGTAISGATSASFSIASATTANAGTYTVVVTNPTGSVTSDGATLTVNSPIVTPPPSGGGGGGGGGGGAPSPWFCVALVALGFGRIFRRARS